MKAYDVWVDNSDKGSGIVWAKIVQKAKEHGIDLKEK